MRLFGLIVAILAAILLLTFTFHERGGDASSKVEYGPKSLTGVLLRAPVSLTRRGTHLLALNGSPSMYVESTTVNLADLEGLTVFVQGTLEKNTSSNDLPVLIAHAAQASFTNALVKPWAIADLRMKIDVPAHWNGTVEGPKARFRTGETEASVLTIASISGSTLPAGKPLFIHNMKATRTENGTARDVYIKLEKSILHLHFDAAMQESVSRLEDASVLLQQFEDILNSLRFDGVSSSKSTHGSGSTVGGGICGGAAKILCPSGSYCNVTDKATGEGICRSR
ncbi:MAG: hypothetical protein ABL890_00920 [Candidatus Peribacteraceae bacterium]